MSRVKRSTNPYKIGETQLWSTPEYDDLSRTKKVTSPDTTNVQIVYGLSISGVIGTTKTITDQAGKKRMGISDALGNTVRVIEDPIDVNNPNGQNLSTDYVFDTLSNLRKTTQGEQNRYFNYDSLGRVLFAKQPEQDTNAAFIATDPISGNTNWSVKYLYDDNGNITTTTDARNTSITGTYDRFNRLINRNYSDPATPAVSFYYDGTGLGGVPNFSKGKTTKVTSSVSETRNTSFDGMGRLLTSEQRTTAEQLAGTQTPYSFGYTYNLSGALIEETYPSGRVVKNTLNADGELSQVQSKKNANYGFFTYADSFSYNSAGSVTKLQLGNGRWETASYNDRLQVTQIGLGSTDTTQNLLKLDFVYGTSDNNGSMKSQTITVPTVGSNPGFTATQSYAYDSLNRIQSATETVSSTQTWKQTFQYDRYGNRRFDAANTTTLGSCTTAVCNPTINTANNHFLTGQGYSYDAAGSVTQDATGQRFGYDTENRQKEFFVATNSTSTPDATYLYDGEGKRVKKIVGSDVTIFVYDASGQLAAEYSTTVVPVAEAKVSYLTTDHLGSPRIITDQNGAVISRKDFAAFGDEIVTLQRIGGTAGNGYDPPNVRQDYTGYQKDSESGLEFAQARYYNSQHGRFTSVDPLTASATIRNPQTFNRYSYGLNSPYKFTDPLGLMSSSASATGNVCSAALSTCDYGGTDWFNGVGAASSIAESTVSASKSVTLLLNIIYDAAQYTATSAAVAVLETVQDLKDTMRVIGIEFRIIYTAGKASKGDAASGCNGCVYRIDEGAVQGAVNVFLSRNDNARNLGNDSRYLPDYKQISLEQWGKSKFSANTLAHEVGHLFRQITGAWKGMSGTNVWLDPLGMRQADSSNFSEDRIINKTNADLKSGLYKRTNMYDAESYGAVPPYKYYQEGAQLLSVMYTSGSRPR